MRSVQRALPPCAAAALRPASAAAASAASGTDLRVRLAAQRAALHTSSAARQKTAAKVGAAKAKTSSAAALFLRAGEGAPGGGTAAAGAAASAASRAFDFTQPLLPKHQAIFVAPPRDPASRFTPASRRVGVIGLKCGMTADWDAWGVRHALTVVKLEANVVTGVCTDAARGYTALQVGAGLPKLKNLARPLVGYFEAQHVAPRSALHEFRVTPDALLPIGTPLPAQHFMPGQAVNVQGVTQGKGFQGAMKRWGFAGQGASHGNSVSHRVLGSTGCRHDPGRVARGKKMPGHMGESTRTTEALIVWKVDVRRQLLYLKGAVPGKAGSNLHIYDAPKRPFSETHPGAAPPFPTYTLTDADREADAKWAAGAYMTPEEELLVDAASLGVGPVAHASSSGAGGSVAGGRQAATPLAAQRIGHLVSNVSPDTEALIKAAQRVGVPLDAATSAVPAPVLAALAAKERAPPCEWIMKPPAVDPFSIPEADEPED